MKLTKEHILELFRQLPVDISCDYVNPGIYSVRRKPIEGMKYILHCMRMK